MNQTYITPSQSLKNKEKEKYKKLYPNKTITVQSSDTYGLDRALKPAKTQNSRDILVIVHHKNSIDEEKWNKTEHQEWIDLLDYSQTCREKSQKIVLENFKSNFQTWNGAANKPFLHLIINSNKNKHFISKIVKSQNQT
jgi:hypothetical protein